MYRTSFVAAVAIALVNGQLVAQQTPVGTADRESGEALKAVDKVTPVIVKTAQDLWKTAEISLLEVKSSAMLKKTLTENGFKLTKEKAGGVPTAFVAEYGSGKPILGVMLEYDALPGLGNAAVPQKQDREDGVTSGHGCGHNLIGAGALGAALALKDLMEQNKTPGTLRVYGGASEETEGAKVFMAREGDFNDLDAMLHWHPSPMAAVANVRTSAQQQLYIEFTGKPAHAGNAPWEGRNALAAVELFCHGVNNMREHLKPTARVHYIIVNGGQAANVIPEKAAVQLTFREVDRKSVEEGVAWLQDIAKGAGLMTQTKSFVVPYYGMYDLLPNTPLAARMQQHLESVGVPRFTDEEQKFAKQLQKSAGVEPSGMSTAVSPVPNEPTVGGSTDVGDVSYIVPTMGLSIPTVPQGIGLHTWMATASHGTSIGDKGAVAAAKVLALTGWDILTDAELRKQMKADFDKRTEGLTYKSPLPDFIKEPVGLPDEMRSYGSVLELKKALLNRMGDHQLVPHTHDHAHPHDHEH